MTSPFSIHRRHLIQCAGAALMPGLPAVARAVSSSIVNYSFALVRLPQGRVPTNGAAVGLTTQGGLVGTSGNVAGSESFVSLWQSDQLTQLDNPKAAFRAVATDVNRQGVIVGYEGVFSEPWVPGLAYIWRQQKPIALPTLGGASAKAYGINDSGWVVGMSDNADHESMPTCWIEGVAYGLPKFALGAPAWCNAINDAGLIVGTCGVNDSEYRRAALWTDAHTIVDLGSLGEGHVSVAAAVNNAGQIVGTNWSYPNREVRSRALYWEQGQLNTLEAPDTWQSSAADINAAGSIVGSVTRPQDAISSSGESDRQAACLWTQGRLQLLDELLPMEVRQTGWTLRLASSIEDDGTILGEARNSVTQEGAYFVLTPSQ